MPIAIATEQPSSHPVDDGSSLSPSPAPAPAPDDDPGSFPALEHFRIPNIPPAAYYIPDFITPEEEDYLIRKIGQSPQPKWKTVGTGRRLQYWGGTMSKKGVLLPEPLPEFLTSFPNIVERIESFLSIASGPISRSHRAPSGNGEHDSIRGEREKFKLDTNQVLVNEYQPGQGISPHEDGPAFRPLVATISLGSHTVLNIHHYLSTTTPSPPMIASPAPSTHADTETETETETERARPIAAVPLAHLLVMPRSLLVLSSSLYTSHLHAIAPRTTDVVLPSARPGDQSADGDTSAEAEAFADDGEAVRIANTDLLGDADVVDAIKSGKWECERGTRTSLTFRHAEKVLKGGALSVIGGALKRA